MRDAQAPRCPLFGEQQYRLEQYRRLNRLCLPGQIVLAGSSLMEQFPANELLQGEALPLRVYNRGVSGFVSQQMLAYLDVQVLDLRPSRLFLNIGTNDIGQGREADLWDTYREILRQVNAALPQCRIWLLAYYPCNDQDDFGLSAEEKAAWFRYRTPAALQEANGRLAALAREMGCGFLDLNGPLTDSRGLLRREYSIEGVHLWGAAYEAVAKGLLPYLKEDVQ